MGQANVRKKEVLSGTITIIAKISFTYPIIKKGHYIITAMEKSTNKEIGDVHIISEKESYTEISCIILFDHNDWQRIKSIDDIIFEVNNADNGLIKFNGKNVTILFTKKIIE